MLAPSKVASTTGLPAAGSIPESGTRDPMVAYDRGLPDGDGRTEALRRAQTGMLHDRRRRHPFDLAGFILSGAWAPLERIGVPRASPKG